MEVEHLDCQWKIVYVEIYELRSTNGRGLSYKDDMGLTKRDIS